MKIIHAFEQEEVKTPHKLSARKLLVYEHAQVMMLIMKPGETTLPHITPVDVFFYILEGTGEVKIGDEVQSVTKDDVVFSPAKIVHLVRNTETDSSFRVLVVKTPKPTSETKLL